MNARRSFAANSLALASATRSVDIARSRACAVVSARVPTIVVRLLSSSPTIGKERLSTPMHSPATATGAMWRVRSSGKDSPTSP